MSGKRFSLVMLWLITVLTFVCIIVVPMPNRYEDQTKVTTENNDSVSVDESTQIVAYSISPFGIYDNKRITVVNNERFYEDAELYWVKTTLTEDTRYTIKSNSTVYINNVDDTDTLVVFSDSRTYFWVPLLMICFALIMEGLNMK